MERRVLETHQDLLTVAEVATALRVTTKTVYALLHRGELRGFRIGRSIRVRRDDVAGFVERSREAGLR